MLINEWLSETAPSAIPRQVKELSCYLTVAQHAQAHKRQIYWRNRAGSTFHLEHAKTVSLSCILTGDPGSYKSEAVRFIKKVCRAYNDLVLEKLSPIHKPIPIFQYDKITEEALNTELAKQSKALPADESCINSIFVDELINFLNRRDYVEPLIGALNSLIDQPTDYNVGTVKRGPEFIHNPITSFIAACAPSWFKYLPEALFTGGWSGRCMFYAVPYPKRDERQPLGKVCEEGGADRLAIHLYNLPQTDLVLTPDSIDIYKEWEMTFGDQRVHPLQAIDEWFKRRAIQGVRFASCIALARGTSDVEPDHMLEAHKHMEWIKGTLENVWEELDSDDSMKFRMILNSLQAKQMWSDGELLNEVVQRMRNTMKATSIIQYMKNNGILVHTQGGIWKYNG